MVLDTVKRGEDDEDVNSGELPRSMGRSVIIRVYDALGGRGKGIIETTFFWSVSKFSRRIFLEGDGEEVPIKGGRYKVDLSPFQVATYRLVLS